MFWDNKAIADADIESVPTQTEKLEESDLVLAGRLSFLNGKFTLFIDHILKGSFSENSFTILDETLNNGCYEEALNTYIQHNAQALLFLNKDGEVYHLKYNWNIEVYKTPADYNIAI